MTDNPSKTFPYTIAANDPMGVRQYQLDNGLRIFLSVNDNEPRIFTNIVFRAGSKYDPADTTGLAHYMEHMLFKGTSRIGALDWEKESTYLERIADLFEQYRATADPDERQAIYADIDRLSYEAAQLVAPNEYDRLVTAMGAKQTNAYTGVEQTVYVNDIPGNELGRWLRLERERFRHLALRLFHTELETVYEEFNISQDKDGRKANQALHQLLFPRHPYGTQTTLGRPEHLKNPSMRNIERFFQTYYVPNNLAICISGQLDPDATIALIEEHFGDWPPNDFPPFTFEEQPPITEPQRQTVTGQESPFVNLGWRLGGATSDDFLLLNLVQHLLYNEQAGLLDRYIVQEQALLEAESFCWVYEDYSVLGLIGKPREEQSLDEVERLLLAEVERLRRGDFPDWLLEAALRDMKLGDLRALESNGTRVGALSSCFILGIPWADFVRRYERLEKFTKDDIVRWARERLRPETVAVVHKQEAEDPNVVKVDKPPITPVPLQREAISNYAKDFLLNEPPHLAPIYADFKNGIHRESWQPGLDFHYVYNPYNPTFRLDYIFEMGKNHSLDLALTMLYIDYLGTDRHSASGLQEEFFRLGLSFDAYNYNQRCHISLQGLEESLEAGILLMEHFLANVQPDQGVWDRVVADIFTKRRNLKQDRATILRDAMGNFANYGPDSPFNHRLPAEELPRLDPARLTHFFRDLTGYQHRIYYYGQQPAERVATLLQRRHRRPEQLRIPLPPKVFTQLPTERNQVLFAHFPTVQAEVMLISRGTPHFNLEEYIIHDIFNEYFGYGLSSIVFQELREAKALAYNTYAYYSSPHRANQAHYLRAYVGTQPDKLTEALPALWDLMNHMPIVEDAIAQARLSMLQRIETDRIPPRKLYWEAQTANDLGYDRDLLPDIYHWVQRMTPQSLADFHEGYVRGRHFNILVLGDRERIPFAFLERFGPVRELTMDELFRF